MRLSEYLIERNLIKLPFTKEETVANALSENYSFFEGRFLSSGFDRKVSSVFGELLYCALEADNSKESIEKFYDAIANVSVDRLNIYGSGCQGFVYKLGDKIIKIWYNGKVPRDTQNLYRIGKKKKLKTLPRIDKIGKSWIVRDDYRLFTDKCKKLFTAIFGTLDDDTYDYSDDCLWSRFLDGDIDRDSLTKDKKEALDWLETADEELRMVVSPSYIIGNSDLCLKNIGEDNKGNIIFFDW